MTPAVHCYAKNLHRPLYLHTAPVLPIAGAHVVPFKMCYHKLEHDSFIRFRRAVLSRREPLIHAWTERRKAALLARLPPHLRDKLELNLGPHWPLFEAGDPTYMFGELNDPRAYCFDFVDSGPVPPCHAPSHILDQILVYHQYVSPHYPLWRIR